MQHYKWLPAQVMSLTLDQVRVCLANLETEQDLERTRNAAKAVEQATETEWQWIKYFQGFINA